MANIYKNAKVDLTTTDNTIIYTAPSDSRAIIKSILVSEDAGSGTTITFTITNAAAAIFNLIKDKAIASKATTELLTHPLILEENEVLKAQAADANELHVIASILEITGINMSFIEQEASYRYEVIDGKPVKIITPQSEVTLTNMKTGKEYNSDAEAMQDVQDPNTDTVADDIRRDVKVTVEALPLGGDSKL